MSDPAPEPQPQGWPGRRWGEGGPGGWPVNSFTPAADEHFRTVKAGAGTLFNFTVASSNTAGQWIQIHDTVQEPATGRAPEVVFPVAGFNLANGTGVISGDFPPFGRSFKQGITITNSTTKATYTAGANDCHFDAQYE